MRRRSRARLGTVLALVVSLAALLPAGASAATQRVYMPGFDTFSPATRTITRGDIVRWKNTSPFGHDVKSNLSGYFSSGKEGGMSRDDTFHKSFKQAGTFGYVCRLHEDAGMKGKIVVPIAVSRNGNTFTITAASASMSGTKWRNRIQVKKPGSSSWQTIDVTTARSVNWPTSQHGTFRFRSAVKNSQTGSISGHSPTVTKAR